MCIFSSAPLVNHVTVEVDGDRRDLVTCWWNPSALWLPLIAVNLLIPSVTRALTLLTTVPPLLSLPPTKTTCSLPSEALLQSSQSSQSLTLPGQRQDRRMSSIHTSFPLSFLIFLLATTLPAQIHPLAPTVQSRRPMEKEKRDARLRNPVCMQISLIDSTFRASALPVRLPLSFPLLPISRLFLSVAS